MPPLLAGHAGVPAAPSSHCQAGGKCAMVLSTRPLRMGAESASPSRMSGAEMTPRETIEDRSRRRAGWMAQAQGGDAEAYRALLDDLGPSVASYLARRISEPADVEDAY